LPYPRSLSISAIKIESGGNDEIIFDGRSFCMNAAGEPVAICLCFAEYDLASYINRKSEVIPRAIIEKPPSAELKPDQVDQDTLPPYPILDKILHCYIEELHSVGEIIHLGFDGEMVRWVARMVEKNEHKRKQAALGLKVTTKAFGIGRRIPITVKVEI